MELPAWLALPALPLLVKAPGTAVCGQQVMYKQRKTRLASAQASMLALSLDDVVL